jgi:hypothetical protein
MILPPRPLGLRVGFLVARLGGGAALVAGGVALGATAARAGLGEPAGLLVLALPAIALGAWLVRDGRKALRVAHAGDEVIAELIALDRTRDRYAKHSLTLEGRSYRFRVGAVETRVGASSAAHRPLFVDEAHTRALALRLDDDILFVRADFAPLALAPADERASRERIEQLRDLSRR